MQSNIIKTSDGSHTLYVPDLDEQYHSVNGALTESMHIYINSGYLYSKLHSKTIFEVGFGTGLNCFLTAIEADKGKCQTTYITIEKYPVKDADWKQLNYAQIVPSEDVDLFQKIHMANWGESIRISPFFTLLKLKLDLVKEKLPGLPNANIVYYDAFGPDKQPEMWEPEVFKKVTNMTAPSGILVTYTVKGTVKRMLKESGFTIEKLQGPPGKNEILRAYKLP